MVSEAAVVIITRSPGATVVSALGVHSRSRKRSVVIPWLRRSLLSVVAGDRTVCHRRADQQFFTRNTVSGEPAKTEEMVGDLADDQRNRDKTRWRFGVIGADLRVIQFICVGVVP